MRLWEVSQIAGWCKSGIDFLASVFDINVPFHIVRTCISKIWDVLFLFEDLVVDDSEVA